jgi:site-specific DNA recombinase
MKVCAVYARVSTDRQGDSLANQVDYAKEYIRRLGGEFSTDDPLVYTDFDQSGYYTRFVQRPAIQRALQDAKDGKFHVIVFKEISRISRDQAEHIEIVSRFQMHGVRVIAINDHLDSDRPETLDLLGIHSVMSEMESKRISSRVSSGKKALARRGNWLGEAPIGYRLNPVTRRLEVDEEFADTVVTIFRLFTKERCGTFRIAELLNDSGHYTKNGRLWSRVTVRRVLNNPVYVGDTIYGRTRNTLRRIYDEHGYSKVRGRSRMPEADWIVVTDTHPPLVDRDTFERAQDLLRERNHPGAKRAKHPLTGILRCGRCGSGMVCQAQRHSGKEYRYYTCTRAFRFGRGRCSQPNLNAPGLEKALWQYVIDLLAPYQHAEATIRTNLNTGDAENRRNKLQGELRKTQRALERLLLDDTILQHTFDQLKAKYVAAIERLERSLADFSPTGELEPAADRRWRVKEYFDWLRSFDLSNLDEVRRFFHGLLKHVTVDGKDVTAVELRYRLT